VDCVPTTHWRIRVAAEDERRRDLLAELSASAERRAKALEDGVRELGSKSAVARDLGIDVSAVRRSIREHGTGTLRPASSSSTTTE
jgi:transposase-like protein